MRDCSPIADIKLIDDIDLGMLYWAKLCQEYVRHRQSGLTVHAIRYEDIIGNRNFATRSILEYCGLSASLVDKALRGLEMDSQRNSHLAKSILKKYPSTIVTAGSIERGNALLKQYGLPLIGSDGILEGTITYEMT